MIKNLIKKSVGRVGIGLHKAGLLPDQIVLYVDGGICSQMHFYLVGEMLRTRGNRVIYDLQWFRDNGMDGDGRFCRNFDLLRLFPGLKFPRIKTKLHRKLYEWSFPYRNDYFDRNADPFAWLDLKGPLYLSGYFHDPEEMFKEYFPRIFRVDTGILTGTNLELLDRIRMAGQSGDACAVHVRRGDLAKYNEAYGNPADVEYFIESMRAVRDFAEEHDRRVKFFIFSDEPDYVINELMPRMEDYDVELSADNGSDKGYCDLVLISQCRHVVTSQGSLGKYGALLRSSELSDGLVILMPDEFNSEYKPRYANCRIIEGNRIGNMLPENMRREKSR